MSKFASDDEIVAWTSSFKQFVKRNYYVTEVTLGHIHVIFNCHGGEFGGSSLKDTFHRKKNRRPPTKKMQEQFELLQGYESVKGLHSFYNLILRHDKRTPNTVYDPERYVGDILQSEVIGRRAPSDGAIRPFRQFCD